MKTHKSLIIGALLLTLGVAHAQTASPSAVPGIVLRSARWSVQVSSLTGGVTEISDPQDAYRMDWVHPQRPWGIVSCRVGTNTTVFNQPTSVTAPTATSSDATYQGAGLTLAVHRGLDGQGRFVETYALTNTGPAALSLPQGSVSITVPFNDSYNDGAPKCLTNNCNTHLWAGGNSSWVNAVRMGGAGIQLGLVLTQGSLASYSILDGASTNDRGDLAFNPAAILLAPGQTDTFSWTLFWHHDWSDFWAFLRTQPAFVRLQAAHYTVVQGQPLAITAQSAASLAGAALTLNGRPVPARRVGSALTAQVKTDHLGEYDFTLTYNGKQTWLRANVIEDPFKLLMARVRLIVEKQQVDAPGDPLDGAFIPYDNQTNMQFHDQRTANNHNEGRERLAMGVLVALAIPYCHDTALKQEMTAGLLKYETFVQRELQDDQGLVYDWATYQGPDRRYNYPWVAHLHLAAYWVTKDTKYLDLYLKTMRAYYGLKGGAGYYMIGIPMLDSLNTFTAAGRAADHDELLADYRANADNIARNGGNYPRSEVNYEQSIVGPGVQIEAETFLATKNPAYLASARQQMVYLEAFNGQQPDYHLNDLGIRHWDDYWFGKLGLNGDTFPHYWTTITAVAFDEFADATGDEAYRTRARGIFLNNMCLFTPDGRGSCAFVYPAQLGGHAGYQFDPWANDQDWALVNWLTIGNRHHKGGRQ